MPFDRRYRIGRFGHPAFIRVAIETGTPIVPVAEIGAEESQPVLTRIAGPKRLGLPALPITPTFPLLGLAGLLPLPTKWTIHVGEPLAVAEHYPAASARDRAALRLLRDQVRERLQALVSEGLRRRRGCVFGRQSRRRLGCRTRGGRGGLGRRGGLLGRRGVGLRRGGLRRGLDRIGALRRLGRLGWRCGSRFGCRPGR